VDIRRNIPGDDMRVSRSQALLAGMLAGLCVSIEEARACACCTNTGYRYDAIETLTSERIGEIDRLRFGPVASLFSGEADPADIKGITTPSAQYVLRVVREKARWVFTFRDKAGRSGTLALSRPGSISVLVVDPRRDEREGGTGPSLYREWKLTSPAAGTGVFAPSMGRAQRITLVLQGNGNGCASAADFTHWALVVSGPVARYHLFGKLVQP
jgi:hypothetical protein